MRRDALAFYACPACKGALRLSRGTEEDGHVVEGVLSCSGCAEWFPVLAGVPRLLLGPFRGEWSEFARRHGLAPSPSDPDSMPASVRETRVSFSSKWDRHPDFAMREDAQDAFYDAWTASKFGLDTPEQLHALMATKRLVLDVGCGAGQKIRMMGRSTRGPVFGFDVSSAADHAYRNTRRLPNVHVAQANLFQPPFRPGTFDLVVSDGVLHHTPSTFDALAAIAPLPAPGGELAIHVYRRLGPLRELSDDRLRAAITRLPPDEAWERVKPITKLGKALSDLKVTITVPEDIPELEMKAGTYDLQRWVYYHVLKCYWNDAFSFDENNFGVFDWYHPADAHRHTPPEVEAWYRGLGFESVRLHLRSPNGVSAIGVAPKTTKE